MSVLAQLCITARVWHVLSARRFLSHFDLYFFPTAICVATFRAARQLVPLDHPLGLLTLHAIAALAAVVTLLMLIPWKMRQRAQRRSAHETK